MSPRPAVVGIDVGAATPRVRERQHQFAVLTSIAFVSLLLPGLAGSLIGDRSENEGAGVLAVRFVVLAVLLVYSMHVLVARRADIGRRSAGVPLLIIFLISTLQIGDVLRGDDVQVTDLINILATGIVVFTLWSLRPKIEWLRLIAVFGAIVGAISLLMALLMPSVAYMTSELGTFIGAYKADGGQRLLAGPFVNANALGLILSTSTPFVFLWRRNRFRIFLLVLILPPLYMTLARTSMISLAIMLLFTFIFTRRWLSSRFKKFVAAVIVLSITAIIVFLPIFNTDPGFLTGRGQIWQIDLEAWQESPLLGLGYSWYTDGALSWGTPHTSSHNMMVTLLVHGGLFYLIASCILIVFLLAACWKHLGRGRIVPFLFFIGFLTTGISEGNWQSLILTPLFMLRGFLFAVIIFSDQESPDSLMPQKG